MRDVGISARCNIEFADLRERDHSVLGANFRLRFTLPLHVDRNGDKVMRKLVMLILGILAYRRLAKQNQPTDHSTAMG